MEKKLMIKRKVANCMSTDVNCMVPDEVTYEVEEINEEEMK